MPLGADLRVRLWHLGVRFALAAAVGAVAGSAPQAPLDQRAVVSGRVVDALTGQPIDRALVEAAPWRSAGHRSRRAVLTGADGRFRIDDATPGRVRVTARHSAYLDGGVGQQRAAGKVPSVEVSAGQPSGDLGIRLWPPAIVSGRVTDSTGAPLDGVSVEALPARWRDQTDFSTWTHRAATNDRGEYELSSLPPGRYHVVVHASHLTWAVNARRPQMIFPEAPSDASAMTSEDGRFSWSPTIRASPPPLADGRETVFLTTGHPGVTDPEAFARLELDAGDERGHIDIVMQTAPRVRVRGIAVGPNGPLSHVQIRLRRSGLGVEDGVQATGHADGTFEFLSVPPGAYEFDAFRTLGDSDMFEGDPDGFWARMPLTIGDQDIEDLTIGMTPGVSMRARLEHIGEPGPRSGSISLVPMRRRLLGSGGGTQRWSSRTFEVSGLTPGDYLWRFGSRDNWGVDSVTRAGRDITGEVFQIGTSDIDDVVITITGRPASIRGSVAPPPGTPIELLSVVLFPVEPGKRGVASLTETLVRVLDLPPDGTYTFESVPPGRYVVAAIDEAMREQWPAPDLLERIAATTAALTLATGQTLTHDLVVR